MTVGKTVAMPTLVILTIGIHIFADLPQEGCGWPGIRREDARSLSSGRACADPLALLPSHGERIASTLK
jgi:hypothetical protein